MQNSRWKSAVSVFLLGGALFLVPTEATATAAAPPPAEDGRDEAKTSIALDPIGFNLIRNGRVQGDVTVELIVELNKANDFEEIKLRQPLIQSDFLQALTMLSKARFRLNRPIDPDLVIAFLQPIIDKRLGEGRVNLFVRHAVITPSSRR